MNAKPLPIVFEWNIDNSTELEDRRYESSIFWTSDRHPWKLHFYPHGTNKAGIQDYFSLYVAAVHNDNAQHIWFARYDVNYTILFRSGNLNIQRTGTAHFEDDWVTRGTFGSCANWEEGDYGRRLNVLSAPIQYGEQHAFIVNI
ncbi:hypothetical protein BC938DRAFT_482423 [Jimgerdemannia flammicorona]|uniref:MATH domain-containing protein n=1 Tax=Jimgerdemannia flammicorona TaxID=994334 RepID=A0A433QE59_9FUNG|nr:hypothetical protein BC938DRAFT_482423 [Jimgerdemannia flammicorona]